MATPKENLKAKILTLVQKMLGYNYKIDNGQETYSEDLSSALDTFFDEKEDCSPHTEEDPIFTEWLETTPPAYPEDIPEDLSELDEDSTHRTVTDTEKNTWNGKQDVLESGTNIKTINSQSIVGSGNIDTPNSTYIASDFDIKDLTDSTNLRSTWSGKQDTLTFSTNIETDKASTTKISAIKTLYDWAVGKFIDLSKIVTSWSATPSDANIPSEKLVKDGLDSKFNLSGGNTISGIQNFDSNTLVVDSVNHRVGVRTATPRYTLDVSGSSSPELMVVSTNSNGSPSIGFTTSNGLSVEGFRFFYNGSTGDTQFDNYYQFGKMLFRNNVSGTPITVMALMPDGKVGLGTTSPSTKLDVNGTSNFADNMNILSTKNQYLAASPTADTVNDIRVRNDSGVLKTERCTVANATKGAGTWVDKSKADISPANGSTSALRALYIQRSYNHNTNTYSCLYNSTTGYYEMNGLTDITESEMAQIYIVSNVCLQSNWSGCFSGLQGLNVRTLYPVPFFSSTSINGTDAFQANLSVKKLIFLPTSGVNYPYFSTIIGAFYGCSSLDTINGINGLNMTSPNHYIVAFYGCSSLVTCLISKIKVSLSWADSPLLSLESLQHLVTNRANSTTRITITVHPTVWAKLNDAVNYPTWNALLVDAVANQYIDFAV